MVKLVIGTGRWALLVGNGLNPHAADLLVLISAYASCQRPLGLMLVCVGWWPALLELKSGVAK